MVTVRTAVVETIRAHSIGEIKSTLMRCTESTMTQVYKVVTGRTARFENGLKKAELAQIVANSIWKFLIKKNKRYWCWWKSEHLLFQDVTPNGYYVFEDFGDEIHILSEKEFLELKEC